MPVLPYLEHQPQLAPDCFVAPNAYVIGDVHIGAQSSVWFGAVVRGDVFHIRIGARTNIQDNSVVHVTTDRHATIIGDDVTVGHRVILHGCTVEDGCLIGMGAIVMDRARVGAGSLVGAGALVTEGMEIPPGVLVVGSPARVKRPLTEAERAHMSWSAPHYCDVAADYAAALGWIA
ncbi:MAG: gamma carbonic anhydrase family protein [Myxococcales bacterium]|nr:gamma carbonic anhydrase family protein [Myxococcales bacterium]MCB9651871.1 gamma carbonic anhydrase family protein [Deltaproteobacteria bacterium]